MKRSYLTVLFVLLCLVGISGCVGSNPTPSQAPALASPTVPATATAPSVPPTAAGTNPAAPTSVAEPAPQVETGKPSAAETQATPIETAGAKKRFEALLKYNNQIPAFSKAVLRGIVDKSAPSVIKFTLFAEGLPRLAGEDVFEASHQDRTNFDYYTAWLVDEVGKYAWVPVHNFNPFSAGETKDDSLFNRSDLPPGSQFEKDYEKLVVTVEANAAKQEPSGIVLYAAYFNHKLDPDNLTFKHNPLYPDFSAGTADLVFLIGEAGVEVEGRFTGLPRLEKVDDPAIDGAASGLDTDYYGVWLVESKGKHPAVLLGKFNAEPSGETVFTAILKHTAFKGNDFRSYDKVYLSVEVEGAEPKKPSAKTIFTGDVK